MIGQALPPFQTGDLVWYIGGVTLQGADEGKRGAWVWFPHTRGTGGGCALLELEGRRRSEPEWRK